MLRLSLVPGVGPRIFNELLNCLGSAENVLRATPNQLRAVPGVGSKLTREIGNAKQIELGQILEDCERHSIGILDRHCENYPPLLKQIHDPPNILYQQGELLPQDEVAIAVVGTRHASNYGKKVAERLARGLASSGVTVVSGLARGVDAVAHRAALAAGGRTVAVLGSGLLDLYPAEHDDLAREICQQGAVLSELPPRSPPRRSAFPQRNRIVSGLSLGVVVVEAAERSGALISARLAMEQDREVFAVPGRIDSRLSRGCHRLIRDGAKLVETVEDILEELGPLSAPAAHPDGREIRHPAELKLTDQEQLILQAIGSEVTQLDQVVAVTALPVARVLSTISVLEIRRLVRRVSGTTFVRV
ncbi:MAG: DNA-processing protein DprA [Mariniblastus sp.]|nr:DNA-processing protein DprA [Mariniblastus sp.]